MKSLFFTFLILFIGFGSTDISNAQPKFSDEGAMLSASKCDFAKVKSTFGNDKENVSIEEYKAEMLSVAVEVNCTELFEFLITKKVNINFKTRNTGDTSLHTAALFNRVDLANRLISYGADINAKNDSGWTPIKKAIVHNNKEIINTFLEKGVDVNVKDNEGNTLLIDSVLLGNVDLTKILLTAGIKVDEQNKSGWTALTYVACGSNVKMLKELILFGADINSTDNEDKTPLMWAVISDSFDNAKELINSGANINALDKKGKSALSYATEAEKPNAEISILLRNAGAVENLSL